MLDPNDRAVGGGGASVGLDQEASSLAAPPPTPPHAVFVYQAQETAPRLEEPPRARTWLAGEHAALPRRGMLGVVDGLLRAPANLMYELAEHPGMHLRLFGWMLGAMVVTGVFVGAFAGGYQLLAVPLKLALGMSAAALICLPSLHIFACLAGGEHNLRETTGALLAGITLTGVLLVGFAPVSWVFSQATDSSMLMGGLHLFFLLVSAHFGLRLTRRAIASVGGRAVPALGLWSLVFLLVVLQMSTTLRPLVGPFDGLALADKQFFLAHWFS